MMNASMHPLLARLLPMLVLVHLAGVASKAPAPPQGSARAGGGDPNRQGRRGMTQARHGAGAALRGGVQSLRNSNGALPHQRGQQMNPYAVLGNVGNRA
jgi:hypothetical protein